MKIMHWKECEDVVIEKYPYKGKHNDVNGISIRWLSRHGDDGNGNPEYGLRFFTAKPGGSIPQPRQMRRLVSSAALACGLIWASPTIVTSEIPECSVDRPAILPALHRWEEVQARGRRRDRVTRSRAMMRRGVALDRSLRARVDSSHDGILVWRWVVDRSC